MKNQQLKVLSILLLIVLVAGSAYLTYRDKFFQPTLRQLAENENIEIGISVGAGNLINHQYSFTLVQQYSVITPENAMKFGEVSLEQGVYDFTEADRIVSFANQHNLLVRGHTLVWTNQLPEWLTEGQWTREQLISILHEHITTMVTRYRGQVYAWDVVNEAVANDGSIAVDNYWYQGIGPDYINLAFQWAHEADPDALLFYNDNSAEDMGEKSNGVYVMLRALLSEGVPVHGVGLEMHTGLGWTPDPTQVALNINRLGDLGLVVHITEMDVRLPLPVTPDLLDRQGIIYRDIFAACLSQPNCTTFITWGISDPHSWIPYYYPDWGAALLLGENYAPKPAYFAIRSLLLP